MRVNMADNLDDSYNLTVLTIPPNEEEEREKINGIWIHGKRRII